MENPEEPCRTHPTGSIIAADYSRFSCISVSLLTGHRLETLTSDGFALRVRMSCLNVASTSVLAAYGTREIEFKTCRAHSRCNNTEMQKIDPEHLRLIPVAVACDSLPPLMN